ncbi:MAG: response regulator transcription factor [Cyanobacteria bacterium K_DeepCast_35m_m2_023]|nr:response regulator transcription factor [Cyanobacteria bacterium K_DeepCast_35m_m2_023]
MDAVQSYLTYSAPRGALDRLLEQERILFCCQSRLLAAVWVRSERARSRLGDDEMPERLVGACTTDQEALALIATSPPTLLVTTQLLERGSGLELIVEAKRQLPEIRSLLFLQHHHPSLLEEAVKTHSDGILLESGMGSGHLMTAIRIISQGGMYLEPRIARLLHGSRRFSDPGLTRRELEVMQQVVMGLNDREIGAALHLATDTVKHHLKQVYHKLNAHNRTRAAIALVLMGLLDPPHPLLPDPG